MCWEIWDDGRRFNVENPVVRDELWGRHHSALIEDDEDEEEPQRKYFYRIEFSVAGLSDAVKDALYRATDVLGDVREDDDGLNHCEGWLTLDEFDDMDDVFYTHGVTYNKLN